MSHRTDDPEYVMKIEIPSQHRRVGLAHALGGRRRHAPQGRAYEAQPLVTSDEELFLHGDLNADEYLSRVSPEGPLRRYAEQSYQRIELMLSTFLLLAAIGFFVTATKLFKDGGNVALFGLLTSIVIMLSTQLALELRRRRRHLTRLDGH